MEQWDLRYRRFFMVNGTRKRLTENWNREIGRNWKHKSICVFRYFYVYISRYNSYFSNNSVVSLSKNISCNYIQVNMDVQNGRYTRNDIYISIICSDLSMQTELCRCIDRVYDKTLQIFWFAQSKSVSGSYILRRCKSCTRASHVSRFLRALMQRTEK